MSSKQSGHLNKILQVLKNKNMSDEATLKKVGKITHLAMVAGIFDYMIQYKWDSVENLNLILNHQDIAILHEVFDLLAAAEILTVEHEYILSMEEIEPFYQVLSILDQVYENDEEEDPEDETEKVSALDEGLVSTLAHHEDLPVIRDLIALLDELNILKYDFIEDLCNHENPQDVFDCLSALQNNSIINSKDTYTAEAYYKIVMANRAYVDLVLFLENHSLLSKETVRFLDTEQRIKLLILKTYTFPLLKELKYKTENESDITEEELLIAQSSLKNIIDCITNFTDFLKEVKLYNQNNLTKFTSNFPLLLLSFHHLWGESERVDNQKFNQKVLDSLFAFCSTFKGNSIDFSPLFQTFVKNLNIYRKPSSAHHCYNSTITDAPDVTMTYPVIKSSSSSMSTETSSTSSSFFDSNPSTTSSTSSLTSQTSVSSIKSPNTSSSFLKVSTSSAFSIRLSPNKTHSAPKTLSSSSSSLDIYSSAPSTRPSFEYMNTTTSSFGSNSSTSIFNSSSSLTTQSTSIPIPKLSSNSTSSLPLSISSILNSTPLTQPLLGMSLFGQSNLPRNQQSMNEEKTFSSSSSSSAK